MNTIKTSSKKASDKSNVSSKKKATKKKQLSFFEKKCKEFSKDRDVIVNEIWETTNKLNELQTIAYHFEKLFGYNWEQNEEKEIPEVDKGFLTISENLIEFNWELQNIEQLHINVNEMLSEEYSKKFTEKQIEVFENAIETLNNYVNFYDDFKPSAYEEMIENKSSVVEEIESLIKGLDDVGSELDCISFELSE